MGANAEDGKRSWESSVEAVNGKIWESWCCLVIAICRRTTKEHREYYSLSIDLCNVMPISVREAWMNMDLIEPRAKAP